jgi:hypothetical protein
MLHYRLVLNVAEFPDFSCQCLSSVQWKFLICECAMKWLAFTLIIGLLTGMATIFPVKIHPKFSHFALCICFCNWCSITYNSLSCFLYSSKWWTMLNIVIHTVFPHLFLDELLTSQNALLLTSYLSLSISVSLP